VPDFTKETPGLSVIARCHVCEGKDVGGTEGGFGVRALLLAAEQSVACLIQGANKELKRLM
jgi:hypothetical protein